MKRVTGGVVAAIAALSLLFAVPAEAGTYSSSTTFSGCYIGGHHNTSSGYGYTFDSSTDPDCLNGVKLVINNSGSFITRNGSNHWVSSYSVGSNNTYTNHLSLTDGGWGKITIWD